MNPAARSAKTFASPPTAPASAAAGGARGHMPARAEHTEFIVEVNAKGQVARVRSGKPCGDRAFNTLTYGNALQAFIRTPDGSAVPGTYRLTYDFSPKTQHVKRGVSLVRAGGVNPQALGAVDEMAAAGKRRGTNRKNTTTNGLPDFRSITGHQP